MITPEEAAKLPCECDNSNLCPVHSFDSWLANENAIEKAESKSQADAAVKHLVEKPRNEKAPVYFDIGLNKTVIRNSKIGACPREIWAYWKNMEPASSFAPRGLPNEDEATGMIQSDPMEEGHLHEAAIKQKLMEKGWVLSGFEDEFFLDVGADCRIIGHADMISAICPDTGVDYIGEIKTMGKDAMADFIENGWDKFPTYPVQISVAMIATRKPGIIWIKNRDNGRILAPIIFTEPPVSRVEILRKVMLIRACVMSDQMPLCGAWRKNSPWCKFTQLHDEQQELLVDAVVRPDLEALVLEYQQLGRTNKEIGEDENGNVIKEKSRRDELREMIVQAMGEAKRLVAGAVGISIGESKFSFNEAEFKLENPELWKKYQTKEKAGSFRVIKIKS